MTWPTDCPKLPPKCDCAHPGECLFGAPETERPSLAVVWIVAAVVVAVVILLAVLV